MNGDLTPTTVVLLSLCTLLFQPLHTHQCQNHQWNSVEFGESIIIWWKLFIFFQKEKTYACKIKMSFFTCVFIRKFGYALIHPYMLAIGYTWCFVGQSLLPHEQFVNTKFKYMERLSSYMSQYITFIIWISVAHSLKQTSLEKLFSR